MLLDPVNSITSVNFYRRVARQSLGRSALYLCYLGLLFSIAATVAMGLKVIPIIDETFQWLERSVPPLTYSGGKIASPLTEPLTVRHPKIPEVAVTIDTARVEPVTPQVMEASKVMAYLTGNAFYLMHRNGKVEIYDFSKGAPEKPIVIDAAFYRSAGRLMNRVLYPISLVMTFLIFLAWKSLAALVYSLLALAANAASGAGLAYGALFGISLYAQTLVVALQGILLFMPVGLPFSPFISLAVTGAYIWLAVRRNAQPEEPPPRAAS